MASKRGGCPEHKPLPNRLTLAIAGVLCTTNGFAGTWDVTPRITLSESYTDNVTHVHSNTRSDFITEVSPGINIRGDGSRLKLNLDYQLQNLLYAKNSSLNNINQGLAANGQGVLLPDWLFLDGTASISQQVVSAQQQISLDNFNTGINRTDVKTYSISPYLHHDFSGYAEGTLRYTHDSVEYGAATVADNSRANSIQAALASGRHSGPLIWNVNYNDQRIQRGSASSLANVRFKNMAGEVDYRVTSTLSAVVQGGREDNSFTAAASQPIVNGSYWAGGLAWAPSRYIAMRGLEGSHFKTAGLTLTPGVRTSLAVTYSNRDVGLNPGPAWSGSLTHSTRNTVWQANYVTDTTTTQQLAFQRGFIVTKDPLTGELKYLDTNGNFVPAGSPGIGIFETPTLTNEVIARKRATAAVTYHRRKTTLGFDIFDERRVYQTSLREERGRGTDVSWGLELSPRTRSLVTVGAQRYLFSSASKNEIFFVRAGLTRDLSRSVIGALEFLRFDQKSDTVSNEYLENRLTARITVRF